MCDWIRYDNGCEIWFGKAVVDIMDKGLMKVTNVVKRVTFHVYTKIKTVTCLNLEL